MEQTAETLPASDCATAFERRRFEIYQPITEPLMLSLAMVRLPLSMGLNAAFSVPKLPWFTTKGQIAQLGFAIFACVFAGIKAWPDMKNNEFLSLGAVLFYLLVAFLLTILWVLVTTIRRANHSPARAQDRLGGTGSVNAPRATFEPITNLDEDLQVTRKDAMYEEKPGITYPSKVYVEIVNNAAGCIEVKISRWLSGIKAEVPAGVFQLWLGYGWFPAPNGIPTLHVPPGERFSFGSLRISNTAETSYSAIATRMISEP